MSTLHVIDHTAQTLTLGVDDRRFDVHAMWLRDACTCADCRRPSSNERLHDTTAIAPDLAIRSARIEAGLLQVTTSDGHLVGLPASWLIEHVRSTDLGQNPADGRELWDATWTSDLDRVDLTTDRRVWLDLMSERGLAKLGTHRSGEQALRDVASSIGPIRPTNYGETWTVVATVDPATNVDSERPLRVHTDLPYLDNPPGVQLMMVENHGTDGGDSTFVDGFAVAERVRATDPDAWWLLATVDFTYPFVRENIELHGRAPLIGLQRNGTYAQVRRAPDLVGAPFVAARDTAELYRAVGLWNALLDGGEFERRLRVEAGDVVMWDNHRVLHGRTGFRLGSHGRRVLHGCYVDVDFLRNEHALAARRPDR